MSQAEDLLARAVLQAPELVTAALEVVQLRDFHDPTRRTTVRMVASLREQGRPAELAVIAAELESAGADGREAAAAVAELADWPVEIPLPTPDGVRDLARSVALDSIQRERLLLAEKALAEPENGAAWGRLGQLQEREREIEGGATRTGVRVHSVDLSAVGFAGERLRALREREQPVSPLPGLLDPEPSLAVELGKPKSGKTTKALNLARAWALGSSPWPGAPALPGTRVLVVSREQQVTRLDGTLRRLSLFAEGDRSDRWADKMTLIARDSELPRDGRRLLTLDAEGMAMLRGGLLAARDAGDPYGLVVLDSLSRLKPPEIEERDNDGLSGWLDGLAELASACGVYIVLIHHVGHSSDPSRSEARSAGRGASAIAAVAQVVWLLERVPQNPNQRRLEVDGNAVLPAEHLFEVAPDTAEAGSILYWRRVDPVAAHDIDDLVSAGETVTLTELAWRISGHERKANAKPPGSALRAAGQCFRRWESARLGDKVDGPRGKPTTFHRHHEHQ